MTAFFLKAIVILLVIIFSFILANWLSRFADNYKERDIHKAFDKAIDKVSSLLTSKIALVMEQYKTGPWYLVVYTEGTGYPLWISNNNIRSIHPDAEHHRLIIKLFNGEDMVIENVDNYELCAANEMCDYDM